jgi:hypothetical protein
VAVVGGFAGVTITGMVIGVETELGERVSRFGSSMLLPLTVLLVVLSAVLGPRLRRRNHPGERRDEPG